jgi:hypothetical protein
MRCYDIYSVCKSRTFDEKFYKKKRTDFIKAFKDSAREPTSVCPKLLREIHKELISEYPV